MLLLDVANVLPDFWIVDLMDFINQKLEERRPFYEQAKVKVQADKITPAKLRTAINKSA